MTPSPAQQALQGQPLLAPDGPTLGSLAAVLGLGLVAAVRTVRTRESAPPRVQGAG